MLPSIVSPDISAEYCPELLTLMRLVDFETSGGRTLYAAAHNRDVRSWTRAVDFLGARQNY